MVKTPETPLHRENLGAFDGWSASSITPIRLTLTVRISFVSLASPPTSSPPLGRRQCCQRWKSRIAQVPVSGEGGEAANHSVKLTGSIATLHPGLTVASPLKRRRTRWAKLQADTTTPTRSTRNIHTYMQPVVTFTCFLPSS